MKTVLLIFCIFVAIWFGILFVAKLIRKESIHFIIPLFLALSCTGILTNVIRIW